MGIEIGIGITIGWHNLEPATKFYHNTAESYRTVTYDTAANVQQW
jgi:hypothetical protein